VRWEKGDLDHQPAAGRGLRDNVGTVGCSNSFDDGEAQAMAIVVTRAARIESLEWLEKTVDLSGRDHWPGVGKRKDGMAICCAD